MPFVSSLNSIPKLVVSSVANRIANLPHRSPGARPLPPWDPTVCNAFEQQHIDDAFFSLANSQIPEVEKQGGDWKNLANLMKTKTVASLSITCAWCRGSQPMSSNAADQSLQICLDTAQTNYLAAWLVVEVVHLCGGTDLDAWAVENWLFNVSKSSYPYAYFPVPSSELELMCTGSTPVAVSGYPYPLRAGKFTVWDSHAGQVWPSDRALSVPADPVPRYGNGLIDAGAPRTDWQWPC